MSERYKKCFSTAENLYATDSPVVVAAGALLQDTQADKMLAQLKLQNISAKPVKAMLVSIQPQDTVGTPLGTTVDYQYLDLNAARDEYFGMKSAIPLPNAATRSFSLTVIKVIFTDNTVWTGGGMWESLQSPQSLSTLYDREVLAQFRLEYGAFCQNELLEQKDLWTCVCGAINRSGEACCHRCQNALQKLGEIDVARLKAAARKRKRRKLALITIGVVVTLVAVCTAFIIAYAVPLSGAGIFYFLPRGG